MKRLFRPATLVVISVALALALAAAWLLLAPRGTDGKPRPKPVAADEHEVVWLYAATNASAWERFVTAVGTAARRLEQDGSGLVLHVDEGNAFPPETTAVPELAVSVQGAPGRLLFRWYKLTSEWKVKDWVEALLARDPPPLAVVGGSSSDLAIDLARQLNDQGGRLGDAAPLLLVTSATTVELNSYYPGKTFRFCFNNQRMAEAVADFVWSQDDLRPDMDPVYTATWDDDPYSKDLASSFSEFALVQAQFAEARARAAVRARAMTTAGEVGRLSAGSLPGMLLAVAGIRANEFRFNPVFHSQTISSSVGAFDRPNHGEADAARFLIEDLGRQPEQRRALLVLPAQTGPSRRFLRALARAAPADAGRFVVATGDSLAFNTIYRDRHVAWPIQDLPFDLVLFCHRNPVDDGAGFAPADAPQTQPAGPGSRGPTGTEDLLLFVDIIEALTQAAYPDGGRTRAADAGAVRERLGQAKLKDGRVGFGADGLPLFDEHGDRCKGTGEHVVCLRPRTQAGGQVLPEADLAVWYWQAEGDAGRWLPRGAPLTVRYEQSPLMDPK